LFDSFIVFVTPHHTNHPNLTLLRTATHCNSQKHTATPRNAQQYTTARCNTLQNAATRCNTLQHTATRGNSRQHAQLTATHGNTRQDARILLQLNLHTETHRNTLHHNK